MSTSADLIADAIFQEEQRIQQRITQDPTNPRLSGVLGGLQHARDIATRFGNAEGKENE